MPNDKKLAEEMNKFAEALKRKGYGTDVSVIVVAGNYKTKSVQCSQIISSNFVGATLETLDNLLANIKVQNMKGNAQMTTEVVVRNKNGETEYISMDDTEKLKEMVNEEVISTIKENYDSLVDTIGEKEANNQILTAIVVKLMSEHDEWGTADNDKKISLIAEFIVEMKEHKGTEWLPDDYTDTEILNVIREVEHIANFGYAPNYENDMSYS